MKIETIKSQINKSNGLMRPNLFLTTVTNPRCLIGDSRTTDLLCSSATLPGKMITVQPHRRFGYGTEDRRVTGAIMPDLSCTFFDAKKRFRAKLLAHRLQTPSFHLLEHQSLNLFVVDNTGRPQ